MNTGGRRGKEQIFKKRGWKFSVMQRTSERRLHPESGLGKEAKEGLLRPCDQDRTGGQEVEGQTRLEAGGGGWGSGRWAGSRAGDTPRGPHSAPGSHGKLSGSSEHMKAAGVSGVHELRVLLA